MVSTVKSLLPFFFKKGEPTRARRRHVAEQLAGYGGGLFRNAPCSLPFRNEQELCPCTGGVRGGNYFQALPERDTRRRPSEAGQHLATPDPVSSLRACRHISLHACEGHRREPHVPPPPALGDALATSSVDTHTGLPSPAASDVPSCGQRATRSALGSAIAGDPLSGSQRGDPTRDPALPCPASGTPLTTLTSPRLHPHIAPLRPLTSPRLASAAPQRAASSLQWSPPSFPSHRGTSLVDPPSTCHSVPLAVHGG